METGTYEILTSKGFVPSQPLGLRKILTTAEQGRKYKLEISGNKKSALFDVDGYIPIKGLKCDKLALVKLQESPTSKEEDWTEIFIELKGTDVAHAVEQLRATLKNPLFKHPSNKIIRAQIVAASFPSNKSNPLMEKAKQEFAKEYHCELKGMKNGQMDKI